MNDKVTVTNGYKVKVTGIGTCKVQWINENGKITNATYNNNQRFVCALFAWEFYSHKNTDSQKLQSNVSWNWMGTITEQRRTTW